ncbi:MAG: carboxylate-amine ligase [Acidobacteria bacterium]|nr:carboxylate-amine ligase [Acidobacteriota bacterium]MBI3657067.1 carboxylate-amine ligase [Acidobacteriota bacterium]
MRPKFTIGIEEEFQTVDPRTRELRSHVSEIIEEGRILLGEQIKPEMHRSVVEVGTAICRNIQEARQEVCRLRSIVSALAVKNDLRIAASGTHPFSDWRNEPITPNERYFEIVEELQDVARSNLIFGLHVHIGIEDRETVIAILNAARYFVPHILALSANSPFWLGRNTGLKSVRSSIFKKFPRTGVPDYFASWSEFDNFVKLLIKTGCIDNGKKIWWDIRPHTFYPTLEFRMCDITMRADETIAMAALIQAIVVKLYSLYEKNLGFRIYRRSLIEENKWRAARYGISGKLIDFGKREEVPTRDLIRELLAFVDDVVDELGSRQELNYIYQILEEGSGADRQLEVYRKTGDLRIVVDYIADETMRGIPQQFSATSPG